MAEVTVIIPTYNRPERTLEAVESVISQTWRDFELIVADDGSDCGTDLLERAVLRAGGRYLKLAHCGVAAARNSAVRAATGRYIAFLDSDDRWMAEKLERQMEYLARRPEFRCCQTRERWIRNGGFVNPREIHRAAEGDLFLHSLELCCISPSAVVLERELFEELGGFDERLEVCEDYELWLRLCALYPVGLVDEPLVERFGGHDDQLSRKLPAMDRFRVFALVKLLTETKLSAAQRCAALEQLEKKCSVLGKGAAKRNNWALSELFSKLGDAAGSFAQEQPRSDAALEFGPWLGPILESFTKVQEHDGRANE